MLPRWNGISDWLQILDGHQRTVILRTDWLMVGDFERVLTKRNAISFWRWQMPILSLDASLPLDFERMLV
jgi:hypothetical protein